MCCTKQQQQQQQKHKKSVRFSFVFFSWPCSFLRVGLAPFRKATVQKSNNEGEWIVTD